MKLPILKIAELTGIHRDTISKRLADLPFEAGKKGAKLYSSEDALAAIYRTDSLEAARAEQARTAAQLNAIRAEDLRKTRIPIGISSFLSLPFSSDRTITKRWFHGCELRGASNPFSETSVPTRTAQQI